MKIFLTINISTLNFWFVIFIAKNFIWTILKVIFSIFYFFAPSDSRFSNSCISDKYCPIITNHTSMESWCMFRWCIHLNFKKCTLMTGFVVQGHIYHNIKLTSHCSQLICATPNWYCTSNSEAALQVVNLVYNTQSVSSAAELLSWWTVSWTCGSGSVFSFPFKPSQLLACTSTWVWHNYVSWKNSQKWKCRTQK